MVRSKSVRSKSVRSKSAGSPSRLSDLVRSEPRRGPHLPAWIERLISVGIVTGDPDVARRQRFTNVAAFATAANALSHLVILALYNFTGLIVVHAYNVAIALAALATARLHRFGDNVAALALIVLILCGNLFIVLALGITSDLQIYFTLAGVMLFMLGVQNWRLFLVFFVLTAIVLLGLLDYGPAEGFILPTDGYLRDLLSRHAYVNTITINALLIFYALTALRRAETALEEQYRRSEALVSAILPSPIAARLKAGGQGRIADRIDNLSVMFADLAGFTAASRDLPPDQVVAYLDDLVRGCEELCERHGVEKIKSIGDGYMAVAGLDGDGRKGAIAIGNMALAMIAKNDGRPPLGDHRLDFRIGLHSGAAMAGVIGGTRFSYDVWGDAVNFAARMESTGTPGRVQVSEAFRALAGDAFAYEPRGVTVLKGLGEVQAYFLRPSDAA